MPDVLPQLPALTRILTLQNMPTPLRSAELARLAPELRLVSFFSAAVEDAHLLMGLRRFAEEGIREGWTEQEFIHNVRAWMQVTFNMTTGKPYFNPDDREEWTPEQRRSYDRSVRHIDSVARLRLIFRTQAEMSAGYMQWLKGYGRLPLKMSPGWRFYRRPGAKTFRDDHVEHDGWVRLKTDIDFWRARNSPDFGGFDNPFPPFGYNSWMWLAPVSRAECERLGLLKPGEPVPPISDAVRETWGLPKLIKTGLGQRSGRVLDEDARQYVIDSCKENGVDVWYNPETGQFEFGDPPHGKPRNPKDAPTPPTPAPTPEPKPKRKRASKKEDTPKQSEPTPEPPKQAEPEPTPAPLPPSPAAPAFAPAATREDAIAYTKTMAQDVSFDANVTLDQINDFNRAMTRLLAEYDVPELSRLGSYVGGQYVGAHANARSLEINADHATGGIHGLADWRDYVSRYGEKQRGFSRHNVGASPEGITMEDLVVHEFGHVIHYHAMRAGIRAGASYARSGFIYKHTDAYIAAKKAKDKANRKKHRDTDERDIYELSEYATTNPREFFAEAFAAWRRGETLPDYVIDMIQQVTAPFRKTRTISQNKP